MAKPIAIDLFSGCGGLTLGLKQAGFKVVGAVDNDGLSVATYKANHPEVFVWEKDISELSTLIIKRKLGIRKRKLDLLAGCPPCQGFSTMRTLNGNRTIKDPRNDLIREFYRFVKDFMPKAVMLENVPGLADDERFKTFLEQMRDLGYIGNYDVLNAADYGVPQRRRRLVYLAGYKKKIEFAPKAKKQKRVKDVIADLPPAGTSGDPIHDLPEKRTPRILQLISKIPKDGGSRTDLPETEQLECHKKCTGFKDVYGRMAWNDVAPTLTSGCFNPSKGRFLHPEENRAITMREAALLQSFPMKYRFPNANNKSAVALMIGNALPPEFIKRHALKIKRTLKGL
ncbi:MAG: DNA cytosine methyltransferase [Desulfobacterales bacterium]|uniref:Cytosine-specific methyltransferase n=1 Tax=Candidatus Desulfatibia vada TaxID=2841696 RepID=A0A8J6P3A3_9BACT|nr:DNA cytosine methyltransferase [Candidatus Desulfatibia vada]